MSKKITILSTLSVCALTGIVFYSQKTTLNINANQCSHTGNHYTYKQPTLTSSGTKEYWHCCLCHEFFVEYTEGTWKDNGIAKTITDTTDIRYVPSLSDTENYTAYLNELGFETVNIGTDGSVSIGKYNTKTGGTTIIIPEGVTTLNKRTFTASTMEWIVFPKSLTTMYRNSVVSATNCTFYFTGENNHDKTYYNCKNVYDKQGVNWDYDKGIPQKI